MKKRTKVLLGILIALLIAVSITFATQWNNIKAGYLFFRYSQEDIAAMDKKNEEIISDTLAQLPGVAVRDLTPEEQEKLSTGELSSEDALLAILNPSDASVETPPPEQSSSPQISAPEPSKPAQESLPSKTVDAELSKLIAQIYVLKASYVGQLDSLRSKAIAEYNALPIEARTDSAKLSIGRSYLGIASGLEGSCDAKMGAITSQIKAFLKKSGGDVSLVGKIQQSYENEKASKKAYYLSLYN